MCELLPDVPCPHSPSLISLSTLLLFFFYSLLPLTVLLFLLPFSFQFTVTSVTLLQKWLLTFSGRLRMFSGQGREIKRAPAAGGGHQHEERAKHGEVPSRVPSRRHFTMFCPLEGPLRGHFCCFKHQGAITPHPPSPPVLMFFAYQPLTYYYVRLQPLVQRTKFSKEQRSEIKSQQSVKKFNLIQCSRNGFWP